MNTTTTLTTRIPNCSHSLMNRGMRSIRGQGLLPSLITMKLQGLRVRWLSGWKKWGRSWGSRWMMSHRGRSNMALMMRVQRHTMILMMAEINRKIVTKERGMIMFSETWRISQAYKASNQVLNRVQRWQIMSSLNQEGNMDTRTVKTRTCKS